MTSMTSSRQVSAAFSVFSNPPPSPPISSCSSECAAGAEELDLEREKGTDGRRTSAMTELSAAISAMPSELELESQNEGPYTPKRVRPALVDSTSFTSGKWSERSGTPTRKSYVDGLETPRSTRSQSIVNRTPRSRQATPTIQDPKDKRRYPLVLLHVKLLPSVCPYSTESMQATLPKHILENFRLLQTILGDTTTLGRGILIPHPRHEYELLEEWLLESLDLLTPRILKCGHFHTDSDDEDEELQSDELPSQAIYQDAEEDDCNLCSDCHSPIKRPNKGVGLGNRLWEVKIYAANGLMRSGAWSAAWSEMERVDAEIRPWIPHDLKKKLERMREEEEAEARRVEAQLEQEALEAERLRLEAMSPVDASNFEFDMRSPNSVTQSLEEQRSNPSSILTREMQGARNEASTGQELSISTLDSLDDDERIAAAPSLNKQNQLASLEDSSPQSPQQTSAINVEVIPVDAKRQVPLSLLLRNYLYLLAKERGYVVFLSIASVLVLLISIVMSRSFMGSSALQSLDTHFESRALVTYTYIQTKTVTERTVETTTEQLPVMDSLSAMETATESVPYTVTETWAETASQITHSLSEPAPHKSTAHAPALDSINLSPSSAAAISAPSSTTATASSATPEAVGLESDSSNHLNGLIADDALLLSYDEGSERTALPPAQLSASSTGNSQLPETDMESAVKSSADRAASSAPLFAPTSDT